MRFLDEIKSPPARFSPAAFWFWYGDLEPKRLREQIDRMMEQGVYNGFMHARAYLKTPYLGDAWWDAIEACIDQGEKTGFYPWLYDEYAWPSGTAGSTFDHGCQEPSRTLAKGECNMSKSLRAHFFGSPEEFQKSDLHNAENAKLLCVFARCGDEWKPVDKGEWQSAYRPTLQVTGQADEILAFFQYIHSGFVDYLNKETIREFMNYTHEEYKARFGKYFGNRVPGIFFDEIFMINNMPWSRNFPEEFQKRCGYDLMPKLYALGVRGSREERKIRRDYFRVVAELYEDTFFGQISEWCEENQLLFTGHIEEWLCAHPGRQGHFFDNMRHLSIPGSDCHDYRYRFPRKITYREPKFSVSVARAYGKERAMSEAMGGAGWGCSLQQFKRGINTLCAMGSSMIVLHGFYSECDSQGTQADWPSSFFFQNPYWRYFKHFAEYIHRICYMNAQGSPVVDIGLYYPIEEMRMETVAGGPTREGIWLDESFNRVLNQLIEHQMDTDMIDEHSLLRAVIRDGRICVGQQAFRVLLFPEVHCASKELKQILAEFQDQGGIVLYYACRAGDEIRDEGMTEVVEPEGIWNRITATLQPDVIVLRGARDNLYVNHRRIEEQEVYFIANSSPRERSLCLVLREQGGVERLNPENGERTPVSYRKTERGTEVELELGADAACWLIVEPKQEVGSAEQENIVEERGIAEELSVPGTWEFLPIPWDMMGEMQLVTEQTMLEIPLALFSSKLHPDGRQIRIQNKEGEPGHCGRHLSLWEASWITRRPDWIDDAQKKELYFRRKMVLNQRPEQCHICITAVNEWTLWINGRYVTENKKVQVPETVDVTNYMESGENLVAVWVRNKSPMGHFNLLSVDQLPEEEMISLLAQIRISTGTECITVCTDSSWEVNDKYTSGWEQPGLDTTPLARNASACVSMGSNFPASVWLYAWERGCPPMLPWGDLPLFEENITYPQEVCYSVMLPAGTAAIMEPNVSGTEVRVTVDGMSLPRRAGKYQLKVDGNVHQLQISMTVHGYQEGLLAPVKVEVKPFRTALFDWRLHGLKWYAGFARYKNTLHLQKKTGRYLLELGQVGFHAEVWINGKKGGELVWEPYRLDVTELLRDGENEIVIIASNSAAVERQFMLVDEGQALGWNRYWNYDNIQREGENLISGLLGPVGLIRETISLPIREV